MVHGYHQVREGLPAPHPQRNLPIVIFHQCNRFRGNAAGNGQGLAVAHHLLHALAGQVAPFRVQAQARFQIEHPLGGSGNMLPADAPGQHGPFNGVNGAGYVQRQQDHIVPGQHRFNGRFAGPVLGRDRAHLHAIGDNDPLKAHASAQQICGNGARVGRRDDLRFKAGHGDMRHHHHADLRVTCRLKRRQFHRVYFRQFTGDDGQRSVAVGAGVAMAGEVLGGGNEPMVLSAANERGPKFGHDLRIIAVGTEIDDGIFRIVVHVHHRGVRHMDAHGPGLDGRNAALLIGVVLIKSGRYAHVAGKLRRPGDELSHTTLVVGGDQQRNFRHGLEFHQIGVGPFHRSPVGNQPADLVLAHIAGEVRAVGMVATVILAFDAQGNELPDLLA